MSQYTKGYLDGLKAAYAETATKDAFRQGVPSHKIRAAIATLIEHHGGDPDDACTECGASTDGGDGYDGLCGNCADRTDDGKP